MFSFFFLSTADLRLTPNEFVPLHSGDRLTFGSSHSKRSFIVREADDSAYPPNVQHLSTDDSSPIISEVRTLSSFECLYSTTASRHSYMSSSQFISSLFIIVE